MFAIVLAGQPNQGLLRTESDVAFEAEIPLLGRPMLDYIVEALQGARSIEGVIIVGPEAARRPGAEWVKERGDMFVNIMAGLEPLHPDADHVLYVTADIPLVTSTMIDEFITRASSDRDVVYPIIPREVAETRFPGTKRTYVRLREGSFTGGNLFVVRPQVMSQLKSRAEVLLAHRKTPLKLARDVGLGLLMKFALGRLSIDDAERRVGRLLGITGQAVIFPYAEAGVDIDKPEDLVLMRRVLGEVESAPEDVMGS